MQINDHLKKLKEAQFSFYEIQEVKPSTDNGRKIGAIIFDEYIHNCDEDLLKDIEKSIDRTIAGIHSTRIIDIKQIDYEAE